MGKSRLAVQAAAGMRRAFPDGVWLVDLAELRDAALLAQTAASAFGLGDRSFRPPLVTLTEHLADRRLLLVLDNCEHLLAACGQLAYALLGDCPKLRVLATSREPLGISGEAIRPVPPLSVPDLSQPSGKREGHRYEAVALFTDRAAATVPEFRLTEDNYVSVVGICRQLDGIPLAIELAAVRLRVLSPQQILDRLADRYTLLAQDSGSEQTRHQTLRGCIEWSFELCSPDEQLLWARSSVFAGSFNLEAVEAVCAGEGLPEDDMLELVTGLVDKSVLVTDKHGSELRYRLLDTLREFGLTKLRDRGEETRLRRRHRDFYEQLLLRAEREWISPLQEYWLARLDLVHANIRAALRFCLTEPGEAESALRMAVSPWHFYWWSPGRFSEGRRWLDRALSQARQPCVCRARALLLGSQLAVVQGDFDSGRSLLAEGRALAQRLGDADSLGRLGYATGHLALWAGDVPAAIVAYEEALAAGSPDLNLRVDTLHALLVAVAVAGDARRARTCHQEVMAITQPNGERRHQSHARWAFGLSAWQQGDLRRATDLQHQSLRLKRGLNDVQGTAFCLEALACVATSDHRESRAATLLGAAEALWQSMGTSVAPLKPVFDYHRDCERQARSALGGKKYEAAFREGGRLTFDEMVAYALETEPGATATPSAAGSTPLTLRERQVARLVARGASNEDIAGALIISQRTAEDHVEHILAKLGFASRIQIISWYLEHQACFLPD
ncbi:ATP-binding protein [Kutzneria kofuensis]|uniref:Non-specific serine/threonine protein kinase n=1 Tax=Kutzneria kofuensis TaxID=103725 RepID=A0A7W9KBZ7_9PSEU|nr:LuxR C-terminal-related transcriptional regulator [Kutzneria kofuensis]MBB5889829.1 non-specific serine/threonine protein kinase [Kutzneria kofuensis]